MTRLAPMAALVGSLLLAGQSAARADPAVPSPAPCVNREAHAWRQVRDVELDDRTLQYCTGDDCWSFDRATHAVSAAANRLPLAAAPPRDPPGVMTDGRGTTLATADATHVEFCPGGAGGKPPCRSFAYKFPKPVAEVYPKLNDARTLGTVFVIGEGELDPPTWLLAFNLALRKQVGRLEGQAIRVLDHGFLVDDQTFYDARFRKVGTLAAPDEVWIKLGSTDRIALRDREHGEIILQRTTTGKATRIPHGADPKTRFDLIATPDGATLYAIGSAIDEGEVLVIDVATAKITGRATPAVCAPGTHRVN
jgi:hypothetical protein